MKVLLLLRGASRLLSLAMFCLISQQAAAADEVRIVTEEYPPYNMTRGGAVTGLSTDVLRAALAAVGLRGTPQVMPWARAYDTALNGHSVLIYSIARSAQREKLFKWVGAVAPTHWYLMSLSTRHLQLKSLEDARRYQIATVNDEASEQMLIAEHFVIGANLQSSGKYALSYEKLKEGRVDLWATTDLNAYYLARQAGDDPARLLEHSLALRELDGDGLAIAFSANTPDELVERVRKGLEIVKKNGTYDELLKKWL